MQNKFETVFFIENWRFQKKLERENSHHKKEVALPGSGVMKTHKDTDNFRSR
jgi:hypothetical protein